MKMVKEKNIPSEQWEKRKLEKISPKKDKNILILKLGSLLLPKYRFMLEKELN